MVNPSLTKFAKYLRMFPTTTIKNNLVAYLLAPTLWRIRGLQNLPSQVELLRELFREKRFTLIILDACRYDVFRKIYGKYLSGILIKTRSVGSNTFEWMPEIFSLPEFKQIKVFSAHPAINSLGLENSGFKATEFLPRNNIVDVWRSGWSEEYNTVLPEEVAKHVTRSGLSDKNLIWYMQPHFPWIREKQLSREIIKKFKAPLTRGYLIKEKLKAGEISREDTVKNYVFNLEIVLSQVSNLLERVRDVAGKVVVTSDHGELLGEYSLYDHYYDLHLPELITVPWLIVN